MAEESNEDKGKSLRQTKGDRCEQLKGREQETETQNTQNADYNPMVMGNNNNENSFPSESSNKDCFFSELIINENQSFVSEQLLEDDMAANVKQTSERDNNNSERFI